MLAFYILAAICVLVIALDEISERRQAKQQRRVIWNETDARARQRIGEQWAPQKRAQGPWSVTEGREIDHQ